MDKKELTFAGRASEIQKKYKKGLDANNPIAKKSFKLEMDRLQEEQEMIRNLEGLDNNQEEFATGGELQDRLTKAYSTEGELSNTRVRELLGDDYDTWSKYIQSSSNANELRGSNEGNKGFDSLTFGKRFANFKPIASEQPITPPPSSDSVVADKMAYEPENKQYGVNPDYTPYKTNPAYDIASTAATSIPSLNRFKEDPIALGRVNANLVDYDPERRRITSETDNSLINGLNAIRGAGGSRGQQISNIANLTSRVATGKGRALADSYSRQANTNSQLQTEADRFNKDLAARETQANYVDRRYVDENNRTQYNKLGENAGLFAQRLKSNKQNDLILNSIGNYGYDSNGNIVPKVIPLPSSPGERINTNNSLNTSKLPTTNERATLSSNFGQVGTMNPNYIPTQEDIYTDQIYNSNQGKMSKGGKLKKKFKCGGKLKSKK